MARNGAFVTLLTKPAYLPGTLVLHQSLMDVGTQYPFVVMVTPTVTEDDREILVKRGIMVRDIDSLAPEAGRNNLAAHDARFRDTWTKLRAFELEEYEVCLLVAVTYTLSHEYTSTSAHRSTRLRHDCHAKHGRTDGPRSPLRLDSSRTRMRVQSPQTRALPSRLVSVLPIPTSRSCISRAGCPRTAPTPRSSTQRL